MATSEEILEALDTFFCKDVMGTHNLSNMTLEEQATWKRNQLCAILDSLGVVRKIEEELPDNPYYLSQAEAKGSMYNKAQEDMLKAGYILAAPLEEGVAQPPVQPEIAGVRFRYRPPCPPEGPDVIIDKCFPKLPEVTDDSAR